MAVMKKHQMIKRMGGWLPIPIIWDSKYHQLV